MNHKGMRGINQERDMRKLTSRVSSNMAFLDENDIKALEFMANKGTFTKEKVIISEVNEDSVPFVNEVEEFNTKMGKDWQNRKNSIIDWDNEQFKKDAQFVVDFIREELEELELSIKQGNIVEILDAILDITYVSLGNGAMVFGMKDKLKKGYAEVQASNMSKICKTEDEAIETVKVRSQQKGFPCYYKPVGDGFVVYRSSDDKVMKSINYFAPDLKQFFTEEELKASYAYQNK